MKSTALFLILLVTTSLVWADAQCASVSASAGDAQIQVAQSVFDGGLQELAIIHQAAGSNQKITRLSFAGSKETGCHFPAIAVLKGGDWGWHVVWTSSANRGVFYARVDGEAWVSSLPKKLSPDVAELVTLKAVQGKLTITAKYPANLNLAEQQFVSEDEGRSWDSVSP